MKLLLALFVFFTLIVGGAVLAPNFIDLNQYKGEILEQVETQTGLKAKIDGDLSISFLPSPKAIIQNVSITDPKNPKQNLLSLDELNIHIGISEIMQGKLAVTSLQLKKPTIKIEKDAAGAFNYMTPQIEKLTKIGEAANTLSQKSSSNAPSSPSSAQSQPFDIAFNNIEITDGIFMYTDATSKSTTEIKDINTKIAILSLQGPFTAKGALNVNAMPITYNAKIGQIENGAMSLNINGQAAAIEYGYAGILEISPAIVLQGQANIQIASLKTVAPDAPDINNIAAKGFITASPESIKITESEISVDTHTFKNETEIALAPALNANIRLSDLPGKGTIIFNGSGDVSVLNYTLKGDIQNTAELLNAFLPTDQASTFQNITTSLFDLKGQASADQFTLSEGVINLNDVKLSASGDYSPATKDSDMKLSANLLVNDPALLAGAFGTDTSAWPQNIGSSSADLKATGGFDAMNINTTIKALSSTIKITGPISNLSTAPIYNNLDVHFSHPNLRAVLKALKIEAPAYAALSQPIDIKTKLAVDGASYNLNSVSGKILGTSVSGNLGMNIGGSKPDLSGKLKFGTLSLKTQKKSPDAASSAGSSSTGTSANRSNEKWPSTPLNNAWLHSMNANFDIAADALMYETWDMKSPSIKFTLQDGRASVSELKAGLYDGQISLSGSLASATPEAPVNLDGQVQITNVNMEPIVKSFTGNQILRGSGRIGLSTTVKANGGSMKALIGSLSGQGSVNGSSIVLQGVDVTRFVRALDTDSKPGDSLLHLWKGVGSGGSTDFDTLQGAFVIDKGVMSLNNILLDGPRAAIDTTGAINLPSWSIKTDHKMSVKDRTDVPPFTLKVSGPLDNPAQTFGGGAINDYLKSKIQRKLNDLVQDKIGADNPLGGVINNLLGGGGAQQPRKPANDNAQPQKQEQEQPKEEDPAKALIRGLLNGGF